MGAGRKQARRHDRGGRLHQIAHCPLLLGSGRPARLTRADQRMDCSHALHGRACTVANRPAHRAGVEPRFWEVLSAALERDRRGHAGFPGTKVLTSSKGAERFATRSLCKPMPMQSAMNGQSLPQSGMCDVFLGQHSMSRHHHVGRHLHLGRHRRVGRHCHIVRHHHAGVRGCHRRRHLHRRGADRQQHRGQYQPGDDDQRDEAPYGGDPDHG